MLNNFGYESYKKLKEELKPMAGEQEKLSVYIDSLKENFPLHSGVKINGTGYTGRIVKYSNSIGGFYPGLRYPLIIEITASKDTKFAHAVGCVFEYTADQVVVLKEKQYNNDIDIAT